MRERGRESHCKMLINITLCSVKYVTSKPSLSCSARNVIKTVKNAVNMRSDLTDLFILQ